MLFFDSWRGYGFQVHLLTLHLSEFLYESANYPQDSFEFHELPLLVLHIQSIVILPLISCKIIILEWLTFSG